MNSANGIGYPIFNVFNSGVFVETIELPLTNRAGLIENNEEKYIDYENINYGYRKVIKGWIIHFKLFYSEFTDRVTTQKIIRLLNYEKNGYTINLTPRSDLLGRFFTVVGENQNISIGVLKNGAGNRLIELNYRTKELVNNLEAFTIPETRYIGQSLPQCCGILQT